jgi:hypothetical protein
LQLTEVLVAVLITHILSFFHESHDAQRREKVEKGQF